MPHVAPRSSPRTLTDLRSHRPLPAHTVVHRLALPRCALCSEKLGEEVVHSPMWAHLLHGCQEHMGTPSSIMKIQHFTIGEARRKLEQSGPIDEDCERELAIARRFMEKTEEENERLFDATAKDAGMAFKAEKEALDDQFNVMNESTRAGPDPQANRVSSRARASVELWRICTLPTWCLNSATHVRVADLYADLYAFRPPVVLLRRASRPTIRTSR